VKYEKKSIIEALSLLGFKSRSSYYLFARQFRDQGFIGLYDLRPVDRKITITENVTPKNITNHYRYYYSRRPPCFTMERTKRALEECIYRLAA
jgi:hypothetical protein